MYNMHVLFNSIKKYVRQSRKVCTFFFSRVYLSLALKKKSLKFFLLFCFVLTADFLKFMLNILIGFLRCWSLTLFPCGWYPSIHVTWANDKGYWTWDDLGKTLLAVPHTTQLPVKISYLHGVKLFVSDCVFLSMIFKLCFKDLSSFHGDTVRTCRG